MTRARLDLFGGFQLSSADGMPISLTARKARAVLAYLALARGRAQPRDKLAALCWAESNAEQARSSLRQALSAARRALDDAGTQGQQVVLAEGDCLMLGEISVDVCEFEQCAREASPASLARAADLYRGDLLEGFHAAAPAFDHWLAIERERLRGVALGALAKLLAHHEQAGATDLAIASATRLLALDPLQEGVHRALIRLYERQGRQALALKQYRLCRAALQRELGVSPEPETEALYQAILRARREPAAGSLGGDDDAGAGQAAGSDTVPPPATPAAALIPEPQLRHAVVLVASLEEGAADALEPEPLHQALAGWRQQARALAGACGGHITDEIGTRLTIVFGVPVAHGNDAERALHTAGALHAALARLAGAAGSRLQARVGLASGQVLAACDDSNMTLTGGPVGVALQAMEAAEAGGTMVSNRVYQALPGRLEADCVARAVLPGVAEPIPLWRVRRFLGVEQAPAEHAFVGRHAELAQLAGVADSCLRSGHGRVVLIRGEAGIGKSRLAGRFVALARERGLEAHRVLVLDFGAGSGGDPMRMLAHSLVGAARGSGAKGSNAAATEGTLTAWQLAEQDLMFVRDMLELPQSPEHAAALAAMDPASRQRGAQRLMVTLATRRSAARALLIVVEDVHWAERTVLDCLAQLAAATRSHALVLVLTVRPEHDPVDAAWRATSQGAPLTTIDLGPLDDAEAHELAACYRQVDPAVATSCIRRAEGNPLFLDQLLRGAEAGAEEGIEELPGTLQSIVLARLDRFSTADRQALQAAAVLGQRFSPAALRHLIQDPDYACERLVMAAMTRPEGDDYLFMHALIHEAVYASLLKSRRQNLHRRAAAWYEGRDPALMAEHLDAAGDPGAPEAYAAAARHEAVHFRGERALRLVERAQRLDSDAACRHALACLHGELALDLGLAAQSLQAFRQAQPLASGAAQQARVWQGTAAALRLLDRHDEALSALHEAEQAAAELGQSERLAEIESLRGNLYFPMGDMDRCLAAHQRALGHARAAGSVLGEARALGGLGDAYYQQGRMMTAHAHFVRCVGLARAHDFVRIECANLPMVGAVELFRNQLDAARASCEEGLRLAQRIGDARSEMLAYDVMTSTAQLAGDWPHAEAHARLALALTRRLGARRFEAEVLARLGLALGALGQMQEAEALLDEALQLSHASGLRYSGPTVLGFLARTARDPGRQLHALRQAEAILAQGCVSHCHVDLLEAAIDVSVSLRRWQEADRYLAALQDYMRPEPFPWGDFLIRRGRALVSAGQEEEGGGTPALHENLHQLRDEAHAAGLHASVGAIDTALARLAAGRN
ncbi:BTAD domain-containing putative transcriptional regulator [Cupriavidus oxalaticus]|jgi:DNA-binding SARP family transcriptional activator/class 3 adenylate cyclase|uniref:AAA family ATPase n=1 Tax=Cupriavidus oxalaticus TaxID=96344 RepID=A0A375G380_9BURK|nr:BTAD domain-containing putative transcriptional regulator [Cupriavidus oxalaticus]QRQ89021.1 AAA family ATPase [Cupriavidus oxalaticus]QRQ95904.1 AAA family ATPase [Cupriavidus oxalaticus]WQD84585.1 BTAD domain-containing putative transcriptional regulator [Cupriavidus oxalaticus]SPC06480.1 Cyclase [Cupriavidus oxalaticus]SPC12538.1 Cyclase [Cupriavidus oxalaticus]